MRGRIHPASARAFRTRVRMHSQLRSSPAAFVLVIGFIGAGVWLRLDQLASQLLLEDEWHAVYRVVHQSPAAIFLDFAHSDSSIPLTLLYVLEARAFGLSELGMRAPLVVAGVATLFLF